MGSMSGPQHPIELRASTLMPSDNSSYLSCAKNCPTVQHPLDSATMGVMMLLSTLQYQAPYMGPYSTAASQAGKAAFIQSGGQAMQDKIADMASKKAEAIGKDAYHSVGITDTQVAVALSAAKVIRDKQIDVNGPRVYFVKTHLTVAPDHGSVGLGIDF